MSKKRRVKKAKAAARRQGAKTARNRKPVERESKKRPVFNADQINAQNWFVVIGFAVLFSAASYCCFYYYGQLAIVERSFSEELKAQDGLFFLAILLLCGATLLCAFSFHHSRAGLATSFTSATLMIVFVSYMGGQSGSTFLGSGTFSTGAALATALVIGMHLVMVFSVNSVQARRQRAAEAQVAARRARKAQNQADKAADRAESQCAKCGARMAPHHADCKRCGWTYVVDGA